VAKMGNPILNQNQNLILQVANEERALNVENLEAIEKQDVALIDVEIQILFTLNNKI
jgi:hypothetical protein